MQVLHLGVGWHSGRAGRGRSGRAGLEVRVRLEAGVIGVNGRAGWALRVLGRGRRVLLPRVGVLRGVFSGLRVNRRLRVLEAAEVLRRRPLPRGRLGRLPLVG